MATKSTHTQQSAHRRYVPGSSRGKHSATTLLAQLADAKRGDRIKTRREELHLTQPAVVELMEQLAWRLPPDNPLHPVRAAELAGKGETAKPPITLRGYQTYEQGGGIAWEKGKLLARVLRMDVRYMLEGEADENAETPSPFAGQDTIADRLDAIERAIADLRQERADEATAVRDLLAKQDDLLKRQSRILKRIESAMVRDTGVRDEIADMISRRGREIVEGRPPTEELDPAPTPERSGAARKSRAAKQRTH